MGTQKIMVMNFLGTGSPEVLTYLTEKAREAVTDNLANNMQVFDPSIIPSEKAATCISGSSCDLEIFDALGADFGIVGEYRNVGSLKSLTLKLYNVQQQKILAQQEVKGTTDEQMMAAIYDGAVQILRKGKLISSPTNISTVAPTVICPAGSVWNGSQCMGFIAADAKASGDWLTLAAGSFIKGCVEGDQECAASEKCGDHCVENIPSFDLMKTEVTLGMYKKCVDAGLCREPDGIQQNSNCNWGTTGRSNHPVNCVDWQQATTYCQSVGGRLPTGSEFEYALRAGKEGFIYSWGNGISKACEYANVSTSLGCEDGYATTAPVGSFKANGYGLYDMAGNVLEWTSGQYSDNNREVRGGSWYINPSALRASWRGGFAPTYRAPFIGFRCAR